MALNFLKWNLNTTDEYVFRVVVLGSMDLDLCSGSMPLLFFGAMIRGRCPYLSVYSPSTIFCSDPSCLQNFRLMLDPKLHFK